MMMARMVFNMALPEALLSKRYRDSGVVTRMCGGARRMRSRSPWGVSPVRAMARMFTAGRPWVLRISAMPARGAWRFFWMSLDSAFRGETYNTWVSSASPLSRPARTSSSMAARKAARVLPLPVGAAIRACRRRLMTGHAAACAGVGAPKVVLSQAAVAGWNSSASIEAV